MGVAESGVLRTVRADDALSVPVGGVDESVVGEAPAAEEVAAVGDAMIDANGELIATLLVGRSGDVVQVVRKGDVGIAGRTGGVRWKFG